MTDSLKDHYRNIDKELEYYKKKAQERVLTFKESKAAANESLNASRFDQKRYASISVDSSI